MPKTYTLIPHMADTQEQTTWGSHNTDPANASSQPSISSTEQRALNEIQSLMSEEALQLQTLLKNASIEVSISSNPFARVFEKDKGLIWAQNVYDNLKTRTEIVRSALEQDIDLDDNLGLFWIACRRFNFRPKLDILELISRDDVLEFYSTEGKQIFSNFTFWALSSYPIDMVLSYEFHELFDRPFEQTQKIYKSAEIAFRTNATTPYETSPHLVKETNSSERREFKMQFRYISPLLDRSSGHPIGAVSTLSAQRLA